jgi:hypothetical protein
VRYRAAAVVLALAAAVAIGQVPMYSDYPWGLVQDGVDRGPVFNLDCQSPLNCTVPSYGDGRIELGDGGTLNISVAFASDAGQALLAEFARDAGRSRLSDFADFASDAGNSLTSLQAGIALFALDAGLAGRSIRADFADDAGFAIFAGDAGRAFISNFSDFAADAGFSQSAALADVATFALDAGLANKAVAADFARDAGSAASADVSTFALDAGRAVFATFAADAGLSVAALWAGDAGFSIGSGLAQYALDAGLANKAAAADFARDAGSAASADISTFALDAGRAVFATFAADAGLSAKAIAADFARDAGSAANADFARDAGSAASADLSTFALDAGRAVFAGFAADAGLSVAALFAADAGNLQCTTCVDATDIATGAVTTPKISAIAVTTAKLDDGPSLSAYDEATVAGVFSRSTATNCTKGSFDGSVNYIRFTVNTVVTNPQVSTTLYVGTSINARTPTAVMRYRLSGGFTSAPPSVIRAINNANGAQTADAPGVVADGAWHTATFDISSWTTVGTLRVDLLMPSTLATTGSWDISYLGTGAVGSGTGALVSYQGNVGIGVPIPGDALEVLRTASTGWAAQFTNGSTAANTTKTVGLELRGTDAVGTEKQAVTVRAVPEDSNFVASALTLSTRSADTVAERMRISGNGNVGIGQQAPSFKLDITGTSLASASASESALHRLLASSSNADQVITRLRRRFFGTAWDSADWQMFRRVDLTDMGGIQFNNTQGVDLTTGGTARLSMSSTALTTSVASHEIGPVSDTTTFIDLHGAAATYTDYTLRIARNAGTNGSSEILHRGTGELTISAQENAQLALRTQATNRLTISGAGVVTVANLAGGGTRGVSVDNTGALIPDPSDAALKTAIEDLHGPLRMVLNMRPVSFLWRDAERYGPQREVGFIAQEMMAAVPEAVSTNAGGTYSLDYSKLVAVVVGAIQELFEDRTALAQRAQALEDRAEQAEARLAQLEARVLSLENYSGIKGCGNCPQVDDGENPP